jgi:hypothetical protein
MFQRLLGARHPRSMYVDRLLDGGGRDSSCGELEGSLRQRLTWEPSRLSGSDACQDARRDVGGERMA